MSMEIFSTTKMNSRRALIRKIPIPMAMAYSMVMIDARAMRFETLRYARDPSNPLNGEKPTIRDLSGHK